MKNFTENEISISTLVDVFQSAFMKTSNIKENRFSVKCETITLTIDLQIKRKLIDVFYSYYLKNITFKDAALIANKINDEKILVRFCAYEFPEDKIVGIYANYSMSYEEGLIAFQLINNTKWVERIIVSSLRKYFKDNI